MVHVCVFIFNVLQIMTRLATGNTVLHFPRLLGIYPTISSNSQFTEFTETWKNYGSVTQLQVFYNIRKSLYILIYLMESFILELWGEFFFSA